MLSVYHVWSLVDVIIIHPSRSGKLHRRPQLLVLNKLRFFLNST